MAWTPGPRPDWVVAVNAGRIAPIAAEAARPLDRDDLVAEARARLGVDGEAGFADLGGEAIVEPLSVLLPALEDEARLTVLGRWMTRRFLLRLLTVRLHLVRYCRADPAVVDEVIEAPVVVTGVPRTGTTILHTLLALDPALRAPVGWELLWPVPPPVPATWHSDPRIPVADAELRLLDQATGTLDAIHEYGARRPKECLSAHSFAFRSEEFTARYHVPTYEQWLESCDMTPAYEAHKLVLQLLQRRWPPPGRPAPRWVLKSPVHLHSLPVLLATYPDVRLAVTHRDPLTVLASVTSLVATLRWVHSDAVDVVELGHVHARRYHADLERLTTLDEAGGFGAAPVHHGHYASFMTDPIASMRAVYGHLGLDLRPPVEAAMAAHLAERPRDHHGGHDYAFADLGLDPDEQRRRFERYCTHFGVPEERIR